MFISFSVFLLLRYRNIIDFCILILHHAVLPPWFISSNSLCFVVSLRYSVYNSVYIYRDRYTSSIPVWMLITSFPCQITLTGASSAVLRDTSDKSRYPSLNGKALSFATKYDGSCGSVSQWIDFPGFYFLSIHPFYSGTHKWYFWSQCLEPSFIKIAFDNSVLDCYFLLGNLWINLEVHKDLYVQGRTKYCDIST